jgi:protein CpxP
VNARSYSLTALCLTAALAASAAIAETPAPATAMPAEGAAPRSPGRHWHGRGEFHHVLRKLNLTPEQKTQIKSLFAAAKPDFKSKFAAARANHQALEAMSPNDPGYPAALATEKANAAARVQARSEMKAQIYAILTPAQQAQIPTIIAADRAAREQHMAAWRAQHPTT